MRIRAGDEALKKHCETAPKNATLMSADIQNEIVDVIKTMLIEKIVKSVRKADFWTILADDTTDRSKKELTAICLRYLEQNERGEYIVREDPVAIVDLLPAIRKALHLDDHSEEELVMSGVNIAKVLSLACF